MPSSIPHAHMPTLGKLVREKREARGLTQSELAEKCDVTESYISRLESGSYFQSVRCSFAIPLMAILAIDFEEFKKIMCVGCTGNSRSTCEYFHGQGEPPKKPELGPDGEKEFENP